MNISLTLTTVTCPVCGAFTFIELIGDGANDRYTGLPTDTRTLHAEWHEKTGTT